MWPSSIYIYYHQLFIILWCGAQDFSSAFIFYLYLPLRDSTLDSSQQRIFLQCAKKDFRRANLELSSDSSFLTKISKLNCEWFISFPVNVAKCWIIRIVLLHSNVFTFIVLNLIRKIHSIRHIETIKMM